MLPSDGAILWTDNMAIPAQAQHPVDASLLMNFVYRPRIAAMIADWVWYVCPVPDVRPIIEVELGHPQVVNSPLMFPDTELLRASEEDRGDGSGIRSYRVFDDAAERREWEAVFGDLIGSGR